MIGDINYYFLESSIIDIVLDIGLDKENKEQLRTNYYRSQESLPSFYYKNAIISVGDMRLAGFSESIRFRSTRKSYYNTIPE